MRGKDFDWNFVGMIYFLLTKREKKEKYALDA